MTAAVEVVPAELLHQLEVVQTVSQRHGLLEADVCGSQGRGQKQIYTSTQGRGDSKARQEDKRKIRNSLCLKKNR